MKDSLILRDATLSDLDEMVMLEDTVFGTAAWSQELVREELSGPHRRYLALEDGVTGKLAGYAGLLAVGTEGDVQTIAISPEFRGKGQGRRLMEALIAAARESGVRELFLDVRADNPVAHALYVSLGFEDIGTRAGYYQPGAIDACVMRLRPLPPATAPRSTHNGQGHQ